MFKMKMIFLVIACLVLLGGCVKEGVVKCPECETCEKCQDVVKQAEVYVENIDWAIYEDDELIIFFEYVIYNFGDAEARDVVVQCNLLDEEGIYVSSTTEKAKNIASKSYVFIDTFADNNIEDNEKKYVGVCYAKSCDNCRILHKEVGFDYEYNTKSLIKEINSMP